MKLRRWDWDLQTYVSTDYPEGMFQDFLDWLFTTKQWRESPERFNERVWQLDKDMAEYRAQLAVATMPVAPVLTGRDKQLANLAKARAAMKAKRDARKQETAHAEG